MSVWMDVYVCEWMSVRKKDELMCGWMGDGVCEWMDEYEIEG